MSIRTLLLVLVVSIGGLFLSPSSVFASVTSSGATVESVVRAYFEKVPVMIEIARCESNFKQNNDDGSVLQGGQGGGMIGVFQFYGKVHQSAALALGFDIHTIKGNLDYAKYLYTMSGTAPWNSSRACWSMSTSAVAVSKTSVAKDSKSKVSNSEQAKLQARVEALTKVLAKLQKLLEEQKAVALK